MRSVGPHLEAIVDEADVDAGRPGAALRRGRHRREHERGRAGVVWPWVLAIALALLTGVVAVDDVAQRRRVDEAADALDAARAAAAKAAEAQAAQDHRLAVAQRLLEVQRAEGERRGEAAAEAEGVMRAQGTRAPIVQKGSSPWCRARDLTVTPVGIVNRSGRRCSLADHPVLLRSVGGAWQPVPVFPAMFQSYSDGPPWTGEFDPRFTAVLAVWPQPLDPTLGFCLTGAAVVTGALDHLGLRLHPDDGVLELPGRTLPASPCRPAMGLWAYDSTDI
jgi:hypothetical protein